MSSSYGWTDEEILDLPVRRFRQIVAAIQRRKMFERRDQIAMMTWQTRQITSFVAAGYMVEKGKGNPALDAAQMLAYDEIEKEQMKEYKERAEELEFDDEGNIVPLVDESKLPLTDSIFGTLGNPKNWRP